MVELEGCMEQGEANESELKWNEKWLMQKMVAVGEKRRLWY